MPVPRDDLLRVIAIAHRTDRLARRASAGLAGLADPQALAVEIADHHGLAAALELSGWEVGPILADLDLAEQTTSAADTLARARRR